MVKFESYVTTPRIIHYLVLLSAWFLTSIPLMVIALQYLPQKTCNLYSSQNYNNIEFRSTLNSGKSFCSYTLINFNEKGSNKYHDKEICSFCDLDDKDFKRDECLSTEFNPLVESNSFPCTPGYDNIYMVLQKELNQLIGLKVFLILLFVFFLIIPVIFICVVIIYYLSKYKNWYIFSLLFTGDFKYFFQFLKIKKEDESNLGRRMKESGYQLIWDLIPSNVSERRRRKPPFPKSDPIYITLQKSYKFVCPENDQSEMVTWLDNKSKFITKGERRYLSVSMLLLLVAISVIIVMFIEKMFFAILSSLVLDVTLPFLFIFILWNILLFLLFLIYKFTVHRIVTNRRIIKIWRIPFYGCFMRYVDLNKVVEVADREQCIYVVEENKSEKDKEKKKNQVKMFKTQYNAQTCINSIKEKINIQRVISGKPQIE